MRGGNRSISAVMAMESRKDIEIEGVVPRKRRALDGEGESAGERRIGRGGERQMILESAQGRGREKNKNKQSWDYIWRSGLAGGLAGSAVCTFSHFPISHRPIARTCTKKSKKHTANKATSHPTGQNCRCPSRPCQNSLPSQQPQVR